MNFLELFIIALGLSMDAFAVAVCKGLTMRRATLRKCFIVGLYFGVSQAVMPLIGYLLGAQFQEYIVPIDHWIVFALLSFIGINMIRGSREKQGSTPELEDLGFKSMAVLALATSIDALAVGVSFGFLQIEILPAVLLIGTITLILSMIGVKLGHKFGTCFRSKAELIGGIILIGMGVKIVLEHTGII